MSHVSYTELRQNLKKHLDEVCKSRAPLVVTRPAGGSVVLLSLEEYESIEETLHLVRSPANAERLLRSIADADADAEKLVEHDIDE
jgi:antitoxin YefM